MVDPADPADTLQTTPGRYRQGEGLYLQVRDATHRSWLFRYTVRGRAREMGLGTVDRVAPDAARTEAARYRKLLRRGEDPITVRKAEREAVAVQQARALPFRQVAEACIADRAEVWRNKKHHDQWSQTLERFVYPVFGATPIADVTAKDVANALKPIWRTIPETAKRTRQRIECVLDFAAANEMRSGPNPATWRGSIKGRLGDQGRKKRKYPSLPWRKMPEFMKHLRSIDTVPARALELLWLTATRSGAVFQARWPEIDFESRVWNIPEGHMKGDEPFPVPLSDAALTVLRSMLPPQGRPRGFIFPGKRPGKGLSNMALIMLIRRMGARGEDLPPRYVDGKSRRVVVPHGGRRSFRQWGKDTLAYPQDVLEVVLSHEIEDKVEARYLDGIDPELHRAVLEDWAFFCEHGAEASALRMARAKLVAAFPQLAGAGAISADGMAVLVRAAALEISGEARATSGDQPASREAATVGAGGLFSNALDRAAGVSELPVPLRRSLRETSSRSSRGKQRD